MDRAVNPYTPNAGAPPRYLAGREQEVDDFRVLLRRLGRGYTEQSSIITGLRGVGKTVLLREYERIAVDERWVPITTEVTKGSSFTTVMASLARRALLQLSPKARWSDRARRAAGVVRSFSLTVQPDGTLAAGLDVDASEGRADSGMLADDLADVFEALGDAAIDQGSGVVFLFDEIQFLAGTDFEALIGAVHRTVQRQLPVTFAGAGLPQLPGLAGQAKSYSERLFRFPSIGELPDPFARQALEEPARGEGAAFAADATDFVLDYTEGYPFFIQVFGRAVWNLAEGPVITLADARSALDAVEAELDESFFRARVQRATPEELRYLRAMATLGPDEQKAADVAAVLGKTSDQLGPIRARLINKGLLYTPRFGFARYTVPQFDRFMKRHMPLDG